MGGSRKSANNIHTNSSSSRPASYRPAFGLTLSDEYAPPSTLLIHPALLAECIQSLDPSDSTPHAVLFCLECFPRRGCGIASLLKNPNFGKLHKLLLRYHSPVSGQCCGVGVYVRTGSNGILVRSLSFSWNLVVIQLRFTIFPFL